MKKLLEFFKSEFPNDVMDLHDGIELLCQCLDNTIHNINEKAAMAFSERKFDKMASLSECVKQVDEMQIKLESYSSLLDLVDDMEELISSSKSSEPEDKKIPNYSDYAVDSDVAYTLIDDFTHKRPASFSLLGKRIEASEWKYNKPVAGTIQNSRITERTDCSAYRYARQSPKEHVWPIQRKKQVRGWRR